MSAKKGQAGAEIKNMDIGREEKKSITRVTTWIAGLVAIIIMIILPLGYFVVAYQHIAGSLETEAEINARLISQVITVNPDLWRYESLRLQDLLNRRPRAGYPETRRVFDLNKDLVAESANPLPRPVMNRSYQLMDAGIPVATIEISRSLYSLVVQTGLVGLAAMAIAFVIFIPLRLIPIRMVDRAQQSLRQYAKELKESNEDVLSFAYIVSHDLRAPLVSIKGFAGELQYALQEIESVLDRCMPHLSEEERTKLAATYRKDVPVAMDFIKSSVGRMDGLINAVLVLSRLGHRELKPEPLDMTEIAKSILSSLAHQIEQRKTVVTIGELPAITADKLAMEQIMGNLLDNALKYLDPVREGKIAVRDLPQGGETGCPRRRNGSRVREDAGPQTGRPDMVRIGAGEGNFFQLYDT